MTAKTPTPAIADIYELSPMQEAMLFQSAYAPTSQAYFDQFSCVIVGNLEVEHFRDAWQALADRHPVLRTSFHWRDLPKPVQVVEQQVRLPWQFEDWRHLDAERQTAQWQSLLEADRRQGFQLERAPLMRAHLARIEDDRYFFAWSHHHIILDGWCLSLVLGELLEHYRALRQGKRARLRPARPYRDYILWLQQQDKAEAAAYWRDELRGFVAPTPLPAERLGAAATMATTGAERTLMADGNEEALLDGELCERLRQLAARLQVTANTLAQGAWALLLQRYGGANDVLFGATVSGRPAELRGVEEMLGVFINTLPVRVAVEPEALLPDWLKRLQAQQAARLAHGFAALSDLQQWSEIQRGTPLFESNLIFMNYPLSEEVTGGAGEFAIREVRIFEQTDVPLTVQVTPGARWLVEATYDSSRFEASAVRRMLGHFTQLLTEFAAEPQQQLAAFSLMTPAERRELFEVFNDSRVEFDADKTVVHRLEELADQQPECVVVECDGRRLTAAALNRRANRLARALRRLAAVEPGDLVALLLQRSERFIESILAVWKCGAAYVPVDPDYPTERIKTLIENARARAVLIEQDDVNADLQAELEQMTGVVTLDALAEQTASSAEGEDGCEEDAANLGIPIRPTDLAYVIYTSGSTGKPKGAMVEHAGMLNHLLAKIADLQIDAADCIAQSASHCFDISLWQMFAAPLQGGKTIVYPNATVLEPERFIERLEADGVTLLEVVPSYLSVLLERAADRADALAKLRCLQVTGEVITPALVERWFRRFPHIPVANAYGPTECSDNITHYLMREAPQTPSISIGRPLRNFHIYIVDEYLNLCPVGVKGEICASGIGVGRGYLGDATRTAAAFLEDPFRDERGVRLYRTGDLGCFLPDGNLLLFGRRDYQVKIRGHRIELGEIEAALARLAAVREAVVIDRRDDDRGAYLCAYYTRKASFASNAENGGEDRKAGSEERNETGNEVGNKEGSAAITGEMLARQLREVLPDFMIPAAFVEMAELPLTANGKVDRKRLPTPDLSERTTDSEWAAARTATEKRLTEVWAAVLGVENPGIHDNFFSLGGDSILSMQVVSQAQQVGLQLAVVDLFRAPTIAELAARAVPITARQLPHRATSHDVGSIPLLPVQRRFLETTRRAPHHYNQSLLIETPPGLDRNHLERAVRVVLAHHQSLRLRFRFADGEWQQQFAKEAADFPFHSEDLSAIPVAEQREAMDAVARRLQAGLDLQHGPLAAVALFERGAERAAALFLVIHHLAVDGFSWRILIADMLTAYRQLAAGSAPHLPPASATFAEWSHRLVEYAQGGISAEEREYWRQQARRESPPLPLDYPVDEPAATVVDEQDGDEVSTRNPINTVASADEVWEQLDEELTAALLTAAPRAYRTEINEVLLTALALAFRDWTGSHRLRLDLESHGREPLFEDVDLSRVTGWFTAEFPVVLELDRQSDDIAAQLQTIKEQLRQIPGRGLGYGLLRDYAEDAALRDELAALPQAAVLFNYLGQTASAAENLEGWRADLEAIGADRNPDQQREYWLEINGLIADGRLKLSFAYSRNLHRRATVERLAERFRTHLTALVRQSAEPQARRLGAADFPLAALTKESLRLLLAELRAAKQTSSVKQAAQEDNSEGNNENDIEADIEDIYALSPVQQGMLFHSLYTPAAAAYFNQLHCVIEGALDVRAFRDAWAEALAHHASLRASFHWQGLASPVQVVHRRAVAEWRIEDWSQLSPAEQEARWAAQLDEDRRRKFALARPPLMRFALFRTADGADNRADNGAVYRFIWSHHHLLLDGWSAAIVLEDVMLAYEARRRGGRVTLAARRPFRDSIGWLQSNATADAAAQAAAYWRETLAGFTTPTPLVLGVPELTARARATDAVSQSSDAAEHGEAEGALDAEWTAKLQAMARARGVTLNTLAQGAWALLLSRYSGEEDVVYGSVVSGRPPQLAGADKMVGVFINTLPARVRVNAGQPLDRWLEALQIAHIEREPFAGSSLSDIQRCSDVPPGTALFDSLLIFENYPTAASVERQTGGLAISRVQASEPNNYPLTLVVTPGREVAIKVMYDRRRFDAATMRRLLGHYETILRQFAASSSSASSSSASSSSATTAPLLGEIEILTADERRQLLEEWNQPVQPLPPGATFLQLFEEQAVVNAERLAVECNGEWLTYGELNAQAERLARAMRAAAPLAAGDRVAVLLPRSLRLIESIVAIWKCGAAYVPIDPDYPTERIKTIIADSGARLLLLDASQMAASSLLTELTDDANSEAIERLCRLFDIASINTAIEGASRQTGNAAINEFSNEFSNEASHRQTAFGQAAQEKTQSEAQRPLDPCELAYVIYTSGSTGKPKGAMVEHRGLLNHLLAMRRRLALTAESVVAQTASHCFDISMWQMFAALTAGGRVVIYDNRAVRNPDALLARFATDGIEVAQFVPSYLAVFLDAIARRRTLEQSAAGGKGDTEFPGKLKALVTIGEILKPAYVERWFELCPGARLINAYGPTEASDSVTHFEMREPPRWASVPIGRAIENLRVYVLDGEMRLCPIGVKGEICIGGAGVGRGYLGDAARTAAAFVKDPFAAGDSIESGFADSFIDSTGARLYKTGDLGCFLPDGNLMFFGRRDDQVKIRGHRIELGEIEAALVQLAGVANAAVVVREMGGQATLCAYVTLTTETVKTATAADLTAEASAVAGLRAALARQLPAYMIPDHICILPAMPVHTSGKINRHLLPDPATSLLVASQPNVAPPTTATEEQLAAIWEEVFERQSIGVDQSFTELGGHSLLAMQIVSRIRSRLRRNVDFADLFAAGSVRALAARLDQLGESAEASIPRLPRNDASHRFAASHAQKRIWLASRSREASPAYNMTVAVWLEGALDRAAWRAVFRQLIERHDSLRAVFTMANGELQQQTLAVEQMNLALSELDFRKFTDGEAQAAERLRQMSETPFDLARGPLVKALLVQVTDDKHLFAIVLHHLVGDAWSLQILFDEFVNAYAAAAAGQAVDLAPPPLAYRDYAIWHQQWLGSPAAAEARDYWRGKLSGDLPRATIPADFAVGESASFAGDSVTLMIPSALVANLRRLAETHRTSLYAVTLAAIYALLFRYTNQSDILIGTQTAGRGRRELEGLVGCLVNTLVLRAEINGDQTIAAAIDNLSATLAAALKYQDYSFDRLLEDLGGQLGVAQTPLFDIQVDYVPQLHRRDRFATAGDIRITSLSEPQRTTKFNLSFLIGEGADDDGLTIEIVYNTARYRRDSMVKLSERLRAVLQAFAEDEAQRLAALALDEAPATPITETPSRLEVKLNLAD